MEAVGSTWVVGGVDVGGSVGGGVMVGGEVIGIYVGGGVVVGRWLILRGAVMGGDAMGVGAAKRWSKLSTGEALVGGYSMGVGLVLAKHNAMDDIIVNHSECGWAH